MDGLGKGLGGNPVLPLIRIKFALQLVALFGEAMVFVWRIETTNSVAHRRDALSVGDGIDLVDFVNEGNLVLHYFLQVINGGACSAAITIQ